MCSWVLTLVYEESAVVSPVLMRLSGLRGGISLNTAAEKKVQDSRVIKVPHFFLKSKIKLFSGSFPDFKGKTCLQGRHVA